MPWGQLLFDRTSAGSVLGADGQYANGSVLQYVRLEDGGRTQSTTVPTVSVQNGGVLLDHVIVVRGAGPCIVLDPPVTPTQTVVLQDVVVEQCAEQGVRLGTRACASGWRSL